MSIFPVNSFEVTFSLAPAFGYEVSNWYKNATVRLWIVPSLASRWIRLFFFWRRDFRHRVRLWTDGRQNLQRENRQSHRWSMDRSLHFSATVVYKIESFNTLTCASILPQVLVKPKIGQPNCASKLKEEIIRNSIDSAVIGSLHPRTAINVVIQEVQVGDFWRTWYLRY